MGSLETIQHFSHGHPLTIVFSGKMFSCNGCSTPGNGRRYRCDFCYFNLHEYCAICPTELSSFMHDHKLVLKSHAVAMAMAVGQAKNCDLCGDPIEGLFYGCSNNFCDFTVHPLCTQLPPYIWHVKDKSHPLRLQRLVAKAEGSYCLVCKKSCTSWRYRCEIYRLDFHLDCVLAPCEKVIMSTSTSTPRSNSISPFPPSSSAPNDAYHFATRRLPAPYSEYSYGGVPLAAGPYGGGGHYSHSYGGSNMNIPPQYSHHYYVENNPPPHFYPYARSHGGYEANIPVTPYFYGGVQFAPPYFGFHHAHGYGMIPYYSSSGPGPTEYSSNHQQHSNSNHQGGDGGGAGGGRLGKKMFGIITQLAIGVASNVLFGAIL